MTRTFAPALLLLAAVSSADARPLTLSMSCNQAQRMVASQGAIVMSTGKHTYDRFVANPGFCEVAEWANSATAPTNDSPSCPMGYVCTATPPIWYDNDRGGGLFSGR